MVVYENPMIKLISHNSQVADDTHAIATNERFSCVCLQKFRHCTAARELAATDHRGRNFNRHQFLIFEITKLTKLILAELLFKVFFYNF